MSLNPYVRRYQESQVASLSPEQLLLMLVDAAAARVERAEAAADPAERRVSLGKVRRIVLELVESLNVDVGGQIAVGLLRAYTALLRVIVDAETRDDPAALAEVGRRVRAMQEMWHATVARALEESEGA